MENEDLTPTKHGTIKEKFRRISKYATTKVHRSPEEAKKDEEKYETETVKRTLKKKKRIPPVISNELEREAFFDQSESISALHDDLKSELSTTLQKSNSPRVNKVANNNDSPTSTLGNDIDSSSNASPLVVSPRSDIVPKQVYVFSPRALLGTLEKKKKEEVTAAQVYRKS